MSKKSAKATAETPPATYEYRDIVLGKVRGYPPWPGMVVNPDAVPPIVSAERPSNKKSVFYCVQFFPTGDYAWLVSKDISKLQTHEIQSYINEPFKKSADLLTGYRIALDPTKWEAEREALSREAMEEEAGNEVDQLESETESGSGKLSKSKKRKRESDAASVKGKRAPKLKKEKERRSGTAKMRKNGSRTMVESEDDLEHARVENEGAGYGKKASPPPAKKTKRDKEEDGEDSKLITDPEAMKVRDWRHKLQRTFLSGKTLPKDQDIPALDNLFSMVENYDKITIEYLQFSKIGKVMRHIAVLPEEKVPQDDQYKFRDRAKALVEKWHQILNANKANGPESAITGNGSAVKLARDDETGKDEKPGMEEPITTAASDTMNGTDGDGHQSFAADSSVLADVTMSEA